MASPSVTCVRQEESNYWILALRSACLHKSPSCFPVFSSSVACSCNYRRSETWKTLLKPKIIVGCQTTEATHLEEFCKKKRWCLGLLFCRGDARFINLNLNTGPLHPFLSWTFYVYCRSSNASLLSAKLNLLVLTMWIWQAESICLSMASFSWRTWGQRCIDYC